MKTRIQRWGNILAVRIPKRIAEEVGLEQDSPVSLSLSSSKRLIEPAAPSVPSLDELLRRVRQSNLHAEVDTGPAQGDEAW